MAGTKDNTPNGTERPRNGAEARSNTQEKRSYSGGAQAGDAEHKDAKVPSGYSLRRENIATSSTDGQQRLEAYRVFVSYPLARWLSEEPGEGYWHSQSRGS